MERAAGAEDAGIVDQNVEAVERALHVLGDSASTEARSVTSHSHRPNSSRVLPVSNGAGSFFEGFARASAEDGVRAQFGEFHGDGLANAASRAGDDGDLAGQRRL